MTVSPVAPAAAGSASRDLSRARMALSEARETDDHLIRYSSAHVAALRVAAAVLAVRARPVRSGPRRRVQRNAWVLLAEVAPEFGEWATFFAGKRHPTRGRRSGPGASSHHARSRRSGPGRGNLLRPGRIQPPPDHPVRPLRLLRPPISPSPALDASQLALGSAHPIPRLPGVHLPPALPAAPVPGSAPGCRSFGPVGPDLVLRWEEVGRTVQISCWGSDLVRGVGGWGVGVGGWGSWGWWEVGCCPQRIRSRGGHSRWSTDVAARYVRRWSPRPSAWHSPARARTDPGAGLDIVDLGGGTGGFAVPLAVEGHRVTVIDPSPDALASLERRASDEGVSKLVRGVQGDANELPGLAGDSSADAVLCHGVLEVVDDPAQALQAMASVLREGGVLSLLVAQRNAVVLARALAGHLTEARVALQDANGRWGPNDPMPRRFDEAADHRPAGRSRLHGPHHPRSPHLRRPRPLGLRRLRAGSPRSPRRTGTRRQPTPRLPGPSPPTPHPRHPLTPSPNLRASIFTSSTASPAELTS